MTSKSREKIIEAQKKLNKIIKNIKKNNFHWNDVIKLESTKKLLDKLSSGKSGGNFWKKKNFFLLLSLIGFLTVFTYLTKIHVLNEMIIIWKKWNDGNLNMEPVSSIIIIISYQTNNLMIKLIFFWLSAVYFNNVR